MALIKELTAQELQKLVDASFNLNSIFDNIVYGLQSELRMPKFASFIHHRISHSFPLDFADSIQEFASSRGVRIKRGIVYANDKIYKSAVEAISVGYNALVEFETALNSAIDICIDENSKSTEDFLRNLSVNVLNHYIHQMSRFAEGLMAYEEDNITSSFNKDFESYITEYFEDSEED